MKQESLKKNFLFQTLYQVVILVIPLIIAPFLTRTLGSEALGVYSYTNSIAYYFLLFVNLGISRHGQRIISSRKDNEKILRKTFWSLYFVHSIVALLVFCVYSLFCLFFSGEYQQYYWIQILYVASAAFDITWLFYGLENFKSVVLKNTFIKVLECALVFIFLRTSDDLWIYMLIMSGSILLGQAIMIPQAICIVKPIKFSLKDMLEHLKPMVVLFVSVIASTLYTVFDKTLIGLMSDKINDVAFYEYASKIINIPKTILAVVGTVMFPRACKAAALEDFNNQKKYIHKSFFVVAIFGSAFMFGLAAVAKKFVIIYYGNDFSDCGSIIMAMTPLLLIILFGDILRSEYLIPSKRDIAYIVGICLSAVLNILLSIFLIPKLGIFGAVVGTLSAESFNTIYEFFLSRKMINIKLFLKNTLPFIVIGLLMFIIVYIIDINTATSWKWLLIEVSIGFGIYIGLAVLLIVSVYRDLWKTIIKVIKNKLNKKSNDMS